MTVDKSGSTTKVSLVTDELAVRQEMQRTLEASPELTLGIIYASGTAAIRDLPARVPGLLVADLSLPDMRGAAIVARVRAILPDVPILVRAADEDAQTILRAIQAGANGYISRHALMETELCAVLSGGATLTPRVAEAILNLQFSRRFRAPLRGEGLTPRELEILNPISLGFSYAEIAERLKIEVSEVRAHIAQVYRKLSTVSRPAADDPARRLRLT